MRHHCKDRRAPIGVRSDTKRGNYQESQGMGQGDHSLVRRIQGEDQWVHHFQRTWLKGEPQDCVGGLLAGSFEES